MVVTILIVFFSLILLIILHELGHFLAAKKFGVKVEEFGIFLPPRLIGKKIGETIYSLNLLPFGAFVKLQGEEPGTGPQDSRSFSQKPVWQRALIIAGGVAAFWIISAILLSIVMGLGAPTAISDEDNEGFKNPKVQIMAVVPNSPAEVSGIKPGDTIRQVKSQKLKVKSVNKVIEVQEFTKVSEGEEIILTIERGKEIIEVGLVPRINPPEDQGAMGVVLVRSALKSYPWHQAPIKGIEATFELTLAIIMGLSEVFISLIWGKGLPPGAQLMGPVGVGVLMTQFVQLGFNHYLNFVAMISIYLAIFNILPIPAVDGGRLLFLGIEKIKGRPMNHKIEQRINGTFFAFLIILMIFVTVRDISRLF